MPALHPSRQCACQVTVPLVYRGEDTGLCAACDMVYDESLYERRLRQHVSGYTYESLSDFLAANDPEYRALVS